MTLFCAVSQWAHALLKLNDVCEHVARRRVARRRVVLLHDERSLLGLLLAGEQVEQVERKVMFTFQMSVQGHEDLYNQVRPRARGADRQEGLRLKPLDRVTQALNYLEFHVGRQFVKPKIDDTLQVRRQHGKVLDIRTLLWTMICIECYLSRATSNDGTARLVSALFGPRR